MSTRSRRSLSMTLAVALLAGLLSVLEVGPAAVGAVGGPAPIEQRNAMTVTADPIPTVQIDAGIVWTQVINGSTVYAGGSFSNIRPAGAANGIGLMPRSNLLAYDIDTGVATSFAPVIDGTVKALALSPDGRRLYVGGSFSRVDGQTRFNVAAFDTATGALLADFRPSIGGSYVNAIVATSSTVYFGGLIGAAGGIARRNLAAASATTGQVVEWRPTTDLQVDSMVLAPAGDKLVVAGRFEKVNDVTSRGMAALDPVSGASLPWAVTATIKNGLASGPKAGRAGIWSVTADATGGVYGTAWVYSDVTIGNLEGLFAVNGTDGSIRWIADCHGDHYGVYSDGANVYSTGHEHDCQTAGGMPQANPSSLTMRNATVYTAAAKGTLTRSPSVGPIYSDWSGYPAPAAVDWYPDWTTGTASGSGQAGWTVTGNGRYVLVGGEFPFVNGQRSQGIARFSRTPATGARQAPRLSAAGWTGIAKPAGPGRVRITIPANWDRDDLHLTYDLRRTGDAAILDSATVDSTYWSTPALTLTAAGLPVGSTQTFTVVARDADRNSATSGPMTATVTGDAESSYQGAVLDDAASLLWRLGGADRGGTDAAGANSAVFSSGATSSTDDALADEAGGSIQFTGSSGSFARSAATVTPGRAFALELWFKTGTTSGGKLVGLGSSASGASGTVDRHVYMTAAGRLVFGTYPGQIKTVQSSQSYNDDRWHHLLAQQGVQGMQLYVDGSLVGSDPTAISAQSSTGYWRLGGDSLAGWPSRPPSDYLSGRLDEFAVYSSTLTARQIAAHIAAARGGQSPVPAIVVNGSGLAWSFDGTGSAVAAGRTAQSYSWNFGDGQQGASATTSHTYAAAGVYTVTLTVTDSAGASASTSVQVTATHAPPVAAFSSSASGLTVSVDGRGSTASDGASVGSWSWNWGDGTPAGSGAQADHVFTQGGTYPVSLTVTDSKGAASSVTRSIAVTAVPPGAIAQDDFGRSVASGWGQALVGGVWNTSRGFTVAGGVGVISTQAGLTRTASLDAVSARNLDGRLSVSVDRVADGGGLYVVVAARKTATGEYRVTLRYAASGTVTVSLRKLVGTAETVLASAPLAGYTATAGSRLQVRMQVLSAGATTALSASVWPDGAAEPSSWLLSASDAQPELQAAGGVGLLAYLSGSATAAVAVGVDDLVIR